MSRATRTLNRSGDVKPKDPLLEVLAGIRDYLTENQDIEESEWSLYQPALGGLGLLADHGEDGRTSFLIADTQTRIRHLTSALGIELDFADFFGSRAFTYKGAAAVLIEYVAKREAKLPMQHTSV